VSSKFNDCASAEKVYEWIAKEHLIAEMKMNSKLAGEVVEAEHDNHHEQMLLMILRCLQHDLVVELLQKGN